MQSKCPKRNHRLDLTHHSKYNIRSSILLLFVLPSFVVPPPFQTLGSPKARDPDAAAPLLQLKNNRYYYLYCYYGYLNNLPPKKSRSLVVYYISICFCITHTFLSNFNDTCRYGYVLNISYTNTYNE